MTTIAADKEFSNSRSSFFVLFFAHSLSCGSHFSLFCSFAFIRFLFALAFFGQKLFSLSPYSAFNLLHWSIHHRKSFVSYTVTSSVANDFFFSNCGICSRSFALRLFLLLKKRINKQNKLIVASKKTTRKVKEKDKAKQVKKKTHQIRYLKFSNEYNNNKKKKLHLSFNNTNDGLRRNTRSSINKC